MTPQDLVTLEQNRGYRQTIAEVLCSRPGYDSIPGHLFAQVTDVGLVASRPRGSSRFYSWGSHAQSEPAARNGFKRSETL
jgi:hypothetical protein